MWLIYGILGLLLVWKLIAMWILILAGLCAAGVIDERTG